MAYSPNVDYRRVARNKAIKYGLDPNIFERQIGVESIGYRPDVISGATASPKGAQGIAQFMPATARGLGVDPLRPVKALDAAARLMASYVRKYGSYRNALIAYNAGPGRVGSSQLPSETVNYVHEILHGSGPGHLSAPSVRNTAPNRTPARTPPQNVSQGLSGLSVPGLDPTVISSLLSTQTPSQPQATMPAAPSFSGERYLNTGMALPQAQPQTPDSSLETKLAAISSLIPQADLATGSPSSTTPSGSTRSVKPGKTLVVGDSLGVGTLPTLRSLLGANNVTGNASVGRSSERGLRVLKNLLRAGNGNYTNVVFDLGTNDGSPGQLAKSLHEALDAAPNTTFIIPTLNGPMADQKNAVLHRIAASNPNVHLVPWHSASQQMQLAQGIHPDATGYQSRADLIAKALGYAPAGPSRPAPVGGSRLVAPQTAWNPKVQRMRPWLAQALQWAHENGWQGTVISGYRTAAQQDAAARGYGLSHYGPGGPQASNHRTGNAVDVTDPQSLAQVLRRYPGRKPVWAGPTIGDTSHFSSDGH